MSTEEDAGGGDGLYMEMDESTHEEYKENFGDFMSDIQNHVKQLASESSRAPQDAYEAFQAFSSAVDWTESWLRGLLCFHIILFLLVCFTHNWESFSTQNYFDKHGSFAAVVYASPLLFMALLQMINFLVLASSALIEAKRKEIQVKRKIKNESKKKN